MLFVFEFFFKVYNDLFDFDKELFYRNVLDGLLLLNGLLDFDCVDCDMNSGDGIFEVMM